MGSIIANYSYNVTASNGGGATPQVTLAIPTAGVYLFNFSCDWNSSGSVVTSCTCKLSGANIPVANTLFQGSAANIIGAFHISGSAVVICTASNYSLTELLWTGGPTTAAFVPSFSFFQATRIA